MPRPEPTPDALRRVAMTTLAYAVAVAAIALALPTVLTPLTLSALIPDPPPVVARTPAPAMAIAP